MPEELMVVGKRLPRVDGPERASGRALFSADVTLPMMLYAKCLRSPHAHAKIVSIDTSKAEALPGVKAVITHKDTPIPFGSYKDIWPLTDRARYVGDEVAAVAATDESIAEDALELIDVKYDVLPAVFDSEEALRTGAPEIHPEMGFKGNLFQPSPARTVTAGDVEKGFAEADSILEDTYKLHRWTSSATEPRACVASWDTTGKLTLWATSQTPWSDLQGKVVVPLNIPINMARIIAPYTGGSFGEGNDHRYFAIAAALAKKADRPVKLEHSREEEILASQKTRHAVTIKMKIGVKKDGSFTAISHRTTFDTGAYASASLGPVGGANKPAVTMYRFPNAKLEGDCVYTNNPIAGAHRGYGRTKGSFALETAIDQIAEKLGIDPVELRLKNAREAGDMLPIENAPLSSCGLKECLLKGAEAIGWKAKWHKPGEKTLPNGKKHGIGTAAFKNTAGTTFSTALVSIESSGALRLMTGTHDIGTGSNTTMTQVAAEVLKVRVTDIIGTFCSDTDIVPEGVTQAASRTGHVGAMAVKLAAEDAMRKLFAQAAIMLKVKPEDLEAKDKTVYVKGSPEIKTTYRAVALAAPGQAIVGSGFYTVKAAVIKTFGALFAEVEVDIETGLVEVKRMVIAQDVGRALNPSCVENQMFGGMIQGIAYALKEDMICDRTSGRMLNASLRDYPTPTTADAPEIVTIIVETIDPLSPFGAKGMGESASIGAAPAILNAVYNAIGVRIKETPVTPDKILKALGRVV